MENILTLNQSVFGTKTVERRISRRALKASVQELYIPEESDEITYDEEYDIDGGGYFKLTLSCTVGGFVSGLTSGLITGFVTGFISGLSTKLGASIGGWKGALICGALGAIVGMCVSSAVNKLIYGSNGTKSITLIDIWLPWVKISYDIDLGEKLGSAFGGFTGGMGGGLCAAAMIAKGYALGLVG